MIKKAHLAITFRITIRRELRRYPEELLVVGFKAKMEKLGGLRAQ
jgi:hypothetical protein